MNKDMLVVRRLLVGTVVVAFLGLAGPAWAQPLLQWTFDEAAGGFVDAVDTGTGTAANGVFGLAATRTTDTPGGGPGFAVDLSSAGVDSEVRGSDPTQDKVDEMAQFTLTTWLKINGNNAIDQGGSGNIRLMSKQTSGSFDGFSWNLNPPNNSVVSDYNGNGIVDAADYTIWRDTLGSTTDLAADGDESLTIDQADYDLWKADFGKSPAPHGTDQNDFRMGLFVGGDNGLVGDFFSTEDIEGRGGDWIFLAVSYDGNSSVDNLNYYFGDETTAVGAFGDPLSNDSGPVFDTTGFADFGIGFTDGAPGFDFSVPGFQDDVRVYNSILDAAALEAVRLGNLPGAGSGLGSTAVPEPSTLALVLLALGAVAAMQRRGRR